MGDGRSYDFTAYKRGMKGRYQKRINTVSKTETEFDIYFNEMEYWFWGMKNENMPTLKGEHVKGNDKIIHLFFNENE